MSGARRMTLTQTDLNTRCGAKPVPPIFGPMYLQFALEGAEPDEMRRLILDACRPDNFIISEDQAAIMLRDLGLDIA